MSIQDKLDLIEEVMDVDEGTLTLETVLNDLDEWDSLSTLALTVEMKQKFKMNLTTDVIKTFKVVKDICDYIPD